MGKTKIGYEVNFDDLREHGWEIVDVKVQDDFAKHEKVKATAFLKHKRGKTKWVTKMVNVYKVLV